MQTTLGKVKRGRSAPPTPRWISVAALFGMATAMALSAVRGSAEEPAPEEVRLDAFPFLDESLADCGIQEGGRPTNVSVDASQFLDESLADFGIQKAIDAAGARGGGAVVLPAGVFRLRRGLVLHDKVTIVGGGMGKTVLVPARKVTRLDVVKTSPEPNRVCLKEIPPDLEVGSAVVSCRGYPPAWYGSPRPAYVTSVDREANSVTLEAPYGLNRMEPGAGLLTFGVAAAVARDVRKGDTEIELRNASLFRPGDELALGEPPNESLLAHVFVREVRGNTLVLEAPAAIDFPAWPAAEKLGNKKLNALVWALFPLIHGANVQDAGVRDLSVCGHGFDRVRPMQTRYTLAGIHLFGARRVKIERVAVRGWPSDGISLQTGSQCLVADCRITGCLGNGLHPGTGLTDATFEDNLAAENGVGLYFCWHNRGHAIRRNRFMRNRRGGITGLGNPGDRENVIEDNEISENGGPGIAINGGGRSGNIIRNNLIENNSQDEPGKHPGIALYAAVEDAREYEIAGNTIRDTQDATTQWVGIEEKDGQRRGKTNRADQNAITGNRFEGHRTADIILTGPGTRCADNGEANVVRRTGENDTSGDDHGHTGSPPHATKHSGV